MSETASRNNKIVCSGGGGEIKVVRGETKVFYASFLLRCSLLSPPFFSFFFLNTSYPRGDYC